MRKYIIVFLAAIAMTACGEYQKAQKSTDYDYKLDFAKRAFEQKKYVQSATILTDIVTVFKGTEKAEDALYLLALSHYENKDYVNSGAYFKTYYTRYPKGKYTELARYYCGYGYYLDSPETQLDQSGTIKAIEELQAFLDYFPRSDKVSIAQNAIFELQDKLTLKELQNAQLYYNLGNYMGNNYESAVIVAKNAIKNYPYSRNACTEITLPRGFTERRGKENRPIPHSCGRVLFFHQQLPRQSEPQGGRQYFQDRTEPHQGLKFNKRQEIILKSHI